jgi:hypothetical protein
MAGTTGGERWYDARRGWRRTLLAACAVALGGCGNDEKLPAPGASGLVVVHAWDRPGEPPARIEAHQIEQQDSSFGELVLRDVLMRLPKSDGVVYLAAPKAIYAAQAATSIVLEGRTRADDGPVRFNGIWRGKLFVGRAAKASFDQRTRTMHFDDVEIASEGLCQWTATADIGEGAAIAYGSTRRQPDVPAIYAALAALPQPLALPEK